MIFDPETPKGAHALERLGSSMAAWLTTVSPDGQPQSMPVWYVDPLAGMGGPAKFSETYNIPIRITPTRGVTFHG